MVKPCSVIIGRHQWHQDQGLWTGFKQQGHSKDWSSRSGRSCRLGVTGKTTAPIKGNRHPSAVNVHSRLCLRYDPGSERTSLWVVVGTDGALRALKTCYNVQLVFILIWGLEWRQLKRHALLRYFLCSRRILRHIDRNLCLYIPLHGAIVSYPICSCSCNVKYCWRAK